MFLIILDYSITHIDFRVLYIVFLLLIYIFFTSKVYKDFSLLKNYLGNILLQYSKVKWLYYKFFN